MPLRLIEMVVPEERLENVKELLEEHRVVDVWINRLTEGQILVTILTAADKTESLTDLFNENFSTENGFRLVLLQVTASIPWEEDEKEVSEEKNETENKVGSLIRVSREELYNQISDNSKLNLNFYIMVILSAVVTAIGLLFQNVPVIIGAMVIAPLLGPNMALALATTLGDLSLVRKSLKGILAGSVISLALAVLIGFLVDIDPKNPQIESRTGINLMDLVLAISSGVAGALASSTGAATSLIGVMVAVALMPPLVALGLMLASDQIFLAIGALWLFVANIICVNLAGVLTFWALGIRPTTWDTDKAKKATIFSLLISFFLLVILILIFVFFKKLR